MPHITLDYSANLERLADLQGLCETLRATAAGLDIFPADGVRVRAFRADFCAIADGHPGNIYLDISVRLREGRNLAARKAATEALFAAARDFLASVIAVHPIMLSLEMREIDAALAPKLNTIRDRIKGGA
jgi:5-carboxymethyl-2-hydroxymuconate isomerase